jgi:hypothetical protein
MAKTPTLQERIEQLASHIRLRERAAYQFQAAGEIVPAPLQGAIARLGHDLELMRLVQAWAEERVDWDLGLGKMGCWTEAEAKLLAAARRGGAPTSRSRG